MIIKTFSKIYGLASLRVGFGIADPDIIEKMNRIRGPFNVTTSGQLAAAAALKDEGFVKKVYAENRAMLEFLYKKFDEMKLGYIVSQSNFIMLDVARDCQEVFVGLLKRGYIVRPGTPFGMNTYIRVTTGTREQTEGFISALRETLGLR